MVTRVFFNGYFWGGLCLSVIALYGFFSGAGILATLSGFVFIAFSSLLSLNKVFRRSPFAILFCFFTFLYLSIPAVFILVSGNDYIFGLGLESIPFTQSDYQKSLPYGFLYLSLFWFALWLGIISANRKRQKINQENFSSIKLMPVLLMGVIVLIVTWIDNQNFANVRLIGSEQVTSFIALIFLDHAYLILAGLLLFFKLNEKKRIVNSRKITMLMFVIFAGFTATQSIYGSKGAILVVFMLVVLFPFSFFREDPHAQVSIPSPKYLVVIVLLSVPLFYLALIQRMGITYGIEPNLINFLSGISQIDEGVVYETINEIFYRFSQGGIDRFFLVFQSFIINTFNQDTSMAFVNYLAKNTLNLLLPGTHLFPESYAPSSQLFSQVIQYNVVGGSIVGGDISRTELIMSLNTQPYTIFGVFTIIFGLAAPIYLFLFTFAFIFFYNKIDNIFIKITMVYFFSGMLSSYGIEAVIGNSAHLLESVLLMYFFIKVLSRFSVKLPVRVKWPVLSLHHLKN